MSAMTSDRSASACRADPVWRAAQLAGFDAFAVTPDVVEIALAALWLSERMRRGRMTQEARARLLRRLREYVRRGDEPWIAADAIWRAAQIARGGR